MTLSISNVSKTLGSATVLSRLSLDVEPGRILAVVGGSGCGKSTLLRLIAGLDTPDAGDITLNGSPVRGPREEIGLVFQEPRLLPWLTLRQNVGFGLEGRDAAERDLAVEHTLERVGLTERADAWPRQLSGGQAQRAALARAIVVRPKALLLDEPFSALDAITRADLQDHLIELWEAFRPTIVLVTHDVDEAVYLADEVVVMAGRPGRIAGRINGHMAGHMERRSEALDEISRKVAAALDATIERRPVRLAAG